MLMLFFTSESLSAPDTDATKVALLCWAATEKAIALKNPIMPKRLIIKTLMIKIKKGQPGNCGSFSRIFA
jgi:hypothetical protein